MAQSSVPNVKAAILTLLEGRSELDGITSWGEPGKHKGTRQAGRSDFAAVWLGDAEFDQETVAGIRPTPRAHTEDYTLPVIVYVVREDDDAQEAEERMWGLVAEVEDALRDNPTPGSVSGLLSAVVSGKFPHNFVEPKRGSECVVFVKVKARTE